MFTIFKEEKVITTGILVFLGLSILVRLLLAGFYHTMIKETDNMATTNNRLLKQCKVKFANCYQLNGGVSNIPVFVDKFLNRLAFGHLFVWPMHAVFHCFCRCRDLQGDHGRKDAGGNPAFLYSKLLRNVSLFFLVSHGGYQGKTQNIKDEPH